jgi:hypothetical protein
LNDLRGTGEDILHFSLTVKAESSTHPMVSDSTRALRRYWSIYNNGLQVENYSATFHYLLCDFNNTNFSSFQNESTMLDECYRDIFAPEPQIQKIVLRDTLNHNVGITGVRTFGDFTSVRNGEVITGNQLYNPDKEPDKTKFTISGIPTQYGVSQNYPNPFNPTTRIDYQLPYASNVSIILYDLTGREVKKLVSTFQSAGNYTVQLNGTELSSGVYFYKIIASNGSQNFEKSLKMILAK